MELGRLIMITALACGPLILLMWFLNLRDRRQSLLLAAVLRQFASPDYRGRIAAEVRCAMFWRRGVVRFYMLAWSCDEIWDAITRLSQVLPPHIRLLVEGTVDPQYPFPVTVETRGRHPVSGLPRPSVATG
jgi:hypothetical protein